MQAREYGDAHMGDTHMGDTHMCDTHMGDTHMGDTHTWMGCNDDTCVSVCASAVCHAGSVFLPLRAPRGPRSACSVVRLFPVGDR